MQLGREIYRNNIRSSSRIKRLRERIQEPGSILRLCLLLFYAYRTPTIIKCTSKRGIDIKP